MSFRRENYKQVFGSGPDSARILIIGDRPGKEEMINGYPFAGRTGEELDRKLWDIRVDRSTLFLANLLLQPPIGKEITPQEIQRDEEALWKILDTHQFDLIVTLGALTTRYFLGPDANLEKNHAIAHELEFIYRFGLSKINTVIFPMYHLAAGFHTPDLQPYIEYDWMILGQYLRGGYQPPAIDMFRGVEHYELVSATSHSGLLLTLKERPLLKPGIDTEGLLGSAWGLSISCGGGSALVYRKGHTPQSWFQELGVAIQRRTILLHNSLHDIPILRELGIEVEDFIDTMVLAFLLQIEPQGLKPLSYRHSGMDMNDYLSVVAPYAKDLYSDYIYRAAALDWEPDTITYVNTTRLDKKTGERVPMRRKTRILGTGNRFAKFALDIAKGKTTDIKKRWDGLDEEITARVEERLGPFPEVGLEHVPDAVAIPYSARDADATFRLYPALAPKIEALGLQRIADLDHSVIPMIERMQSIGMRIDRNYFEGLATVLSIQMEDRRTRLRALTGCAEFNPGSGDMVANYLFTTLGLQPVRLTKSGKRPSVDDKVMEELLIREVDNPLATEFITLKGDYSEAEKLKGTYIDNLDRFAGTDDTIHTNIRITRVVSGRLATFAPNLLAIPVRTQLGRLIRHGFVAREGKALGSWDLDQIEMRVLAHESEDRLLCEVLSDPKRHIHKETTHRIYNIPVAEVNKESTEYMMCLEKDTLVYSSTPMPLKDLSTLHQVAGADNKARRITSVHVGVKPVIHIVTNRGLLTCSREHGIVTLRGLVRAGDLVAGERLPEPEVPPILGDFSYPTIKIHSHLQVIGFWEQPTDAHAYFAGVYTGRGFVDSGQESVIGITYGHINRVDVYGTENIDWQDKLAAVCAAIGLVPARFPRGIRFDKPHINCYLTRLGLLNANGKTLRVPYWVLAAGRSACLNFIGGLIDTDSGIHSTCLSFCTEDPVLAGQVAALSQSLGLDVDVSETWNETRKKFHFLIRYTTQNALKLIPYLRHEGKREHCYKTESGNRIVPHEVRRIIDLGEKADCCDLSLNCADHLYKANSFTTHNSKNISFGIVYMISAKGLRAQMAQRGQYRTEEECQKMIDDWYGVYPGVRVYQEHTRAEAARYGYVRTILGRIRYLPGIHSTQPYIRSEAERAAGNHPIQGGASDIVKRWMKTTWKRIKDAMFVQPLLQVHDELILEFDRDKAELVDAMVRESLEEATVPLNLRVPIRCGVNIAENWGKLK